MVWFAYLKMYSSTDYINADVGISETVGYKLG